MKVLWLSRHTMSIEQQNDLLKEIQKGFNGPFSPTAPDTIEVVQINHTFVAMSREATDEIIRLMEENSAAVLTGVFPAHIAARLTEKRLQGKRNFTAFVPVSIPQIAEDGQLRNFTHSHWEGI